MDDLPPGAAPARLLNDGELAGRNFETYGFPDGHNKGVPAHGKVIRNRTDGSFSIESDTVTGFRIKRGFSGAGVWDIDAQGVLGMVVAADSDISTKAAFMLPVKLLAEAWPELTPNQEVRLESIQLLPPPKGTMDLASPFYVNRPEDTWKQHLIGRQGVSIVIKGPRQVGKSSFLLRILDAAKKAGKTVALLDFQLLEKSTLSNGDLFYPQFCSWLADELNLEDRTAEYWNSPLGKSQRCSRYMSHYVIPSVQQPLVLAMDEVERTFDSEFRTDFFSMLRSWHNNRARSDVWKKLDIVLVTSTEPYQLINDLAQSPFNVAEQAELEDLTKEQVTDLNRRHGSPLDANGVELLYGYLRGHPYLVREALYLVAVQRLTPSQLCDPAFLADDDQGPFGDHLRHHLHRLGRYDDLRQGLIDVIRLGKCDDEQTYWRLRGAGLVRRTGNDVLLRCQLYADYFCERLNG
jgi:hypothetical protein